ncbi:uncharacterized protein LOC103995159 [Musa acuminata AAA Group]|uniref:uncharacterized protein LOC103995159 n=1 Tax=Musa acuminata AAA Group TaxID=214697 RepID=UPI0031D8D213
MSRREPKGKKASDTEVISWKQKKDLADMEEMAVGKQLEELIAWTAMIEAMSDEQLKDYVLNRPESLRSVKTGKNAPGKKPGRRSGKSCSPSQGLMATVWKYHKEDDDEASIS